VANFFNVNETGLIINGVNNAIVALADTIEVRPARELFRP
jgi:hypothetical protein